MSGFLHRLAAVTIGSKNNALHSLARLPYAMPTSPISNDEAAKQTATLGTSGNKQHPVDHVAGQNPPSVRFHDDFDAQERENEVIPSSPEVLIAPSSTGLTAQPGLEMSPSSSIKTRLQQPEPSAKNTAAGESSVWDEGIKTHSQLNNLITKSIAKDRPYPTPSDSATPPPLLPLKNTAHPSALNPGAVAQRGEPRGAAWQSQVEETTEVHVRIGRIEVTAVHEAPPPKRQTQATAKPMTLDEYLARRQRQA
jgi:hypothetical protein